MIIARNVLQSRFFGNAFYSPEKENRGVIIWDTVIEFDITFLKNLCKKSGKKM